MPIDAGPTPQPAISTDPAITLHPAPGLWARALTAQPAPLSPAQRTFRSQLGLPTDRPLIMTGHQAQFWHPGILAKLFALDAAARATGAATAWLIPDQDTPDAELARFPARAADGELTAARWTADLPKDTATCCLAAIAPPPAPRESPAVPSVAAGLHLMREALTAAAAEPTFARQLTRAAFSIIEPLAQPLSSPPTLTFASQLPATDLFRDLINHIRADPARAVSTYNNAVASAPHAELRPLAASSPRGPELPLWRLQPGQPRGPVFAEQLPTIPIEQLAPRALLLTGLMRLAACEVFIHGTGGAAYDRASEAWLRAWLCDGPWPALTSRLALSTAATATLLLPLGVEPITSEQLARARWHAHHARHNPADLGDPAAQSSKLAHIAMLRDLPRRSHARAEAFRVLHSTLDAARRNHHARLDQIDHDAADLAARARAGRIAADRTWPFPLYPSEALRGLRARIDAAFSR
ncbi:MAG: hypothetical protein IT436_12170 [Phycisphaerales bacterium]|nr:hypothetical protein [Phycisphaerales bacterium]